MRLKFILLLPFIEILLFVLFGDFFGFFPVIFYILITGIAGLFLLKADINSESIKNIISNPQEWIYRKIAGVLLLIPGFATDLIGIMLLFNSLRVLIWDFIPDNTKNYFYQKRNNPNKEEVIEAEYKDLDDK